MSTTKQQVTAALDAVRAVADAIRELKRVPSGVLYAQLMPVLSLESYEKIIGTLKGAGLVREENFELIWVEPTEYAAGFTTEELRDHYHALIGDSKGMTRESLIAALRGTEFDEHAFGGAK